MKLEALVLSVPYLQDNRLNVFGDYENLFCELRRDSETKEPFDEIWTLKGKGGTRLLTSEEVIECLKAFFFQRAYQ